MLVNFKDMLIEPNQIKNILTLRYDPSHNPLLPQITWNDFFPKNSELSLEYIEKLIEDYILEKINPNQVKTISLALSGGVDSSLVLGFIRKTLPELTIHGISIKFANSIDETKIAEKIAEHFEIDHHIVYLENYLKELPKAISIIKSPFWDLHWYYVAKKSNSLSKYLAAGDGGDEIFGGYTFRYEKFLSLTNDNSTPLQKVKAYLSCHERDRVTDQKLIFTKKLNFSWDCIYELLLPYFDNPLSRLEQVFLADYNGKLLYNFNPVNSRIVESFHVNLLAPLLDDGLISYGLKIPRNEKYDQIQNIGKLPLRKLLAKNKSDSLITNQKLGFNVNTINLWKSYGFDLCTNYLTDGRIVEDNLINSDWIKKHLKKDILDVKYVNKFLGLLSLEIWYRLFITKELSPNTKLS